MRTHKVRLHTRWCNSTFNVLVCVCVCCVCSVSKSRRHDTTRHDRTQHNTATSIKHRCHHQLSYERVRPELQLDVGNEPTGCRTTVIPAFSHSTTTNHYILRPVVINTSGIEHWYLDSDSRSGVCMNTQNAMLCDVMYGTTRETTRDSYTLM